MPFYIDKNYARQHYAKNSLSFIFISIFVFFISFLLLIFYVSNISIMILATILMILSIVVSTRFLIIFFLDGYKGLSIIDKKIILIKEQDVGGPDNTNSHLYEENKYIYDVISLKEIVINNKFIYVYGNINMKKEFGAGNTFVFAHIFDKKSKDVSLLKIPRIFAEEDKIISCLNNMKKGGMQNEQ